MNLTHVEELLHFLESVYPNSLSKKSTEERESMVKAWHAILGEYPHSAVLMATRWAIGSSPDFIPSAARILQYIEMAISEGVKNSVPDCLQYRETERLQAERDMELYFENQRRAREERENALPADEVQSLISGLAKKLSP